MKLSTNLICFHDVFGIKKTIDIFSEAGFEAITLGKRILRTETAGMTVLSILGYHLEGRKA